MAFPRSITLGSGKRRWVITVRQGTDIQLHEAYEGRCRACGIQSPTAGVADPMWGFWDEANKTVWIRSDASPAKKLAILRHEIADHAATDWAWWAFGGGEEEA